MTIFYGWHVGVVTDTKLFNRTGAIGRWAEQVNVSYTQHARTRAPINVRANKSQANAAYPVGSLANSIEGHVARIGVRQLQTLIYVNVPYAVFVIKGTKSPIFAKSARSETGQFIPLSSEENQGGMYLPPNVVNGYAIKAMYRQRVRGQKANPFLDEAFAATARRHSSLRGYSMVS